MTTNRSRADFLRFVDYLGNKGLIPSATAASRKATANKVLSILSDEEAEDISSLDLDPLMRRFENLHPQQYTPESLQTYKSRMSTALNDFSAYCENPLSFKPSGQVRAKARSKPELVRSASATSVEFHPKIPDGAPPPSNVNVLPVAIRSDLTVQIAGLPFDLSKAEAQKIANIVIAHASVE